MNFKHLRTYGAGTAAVLALLLGSTSAASANPLPDCSAGVISVHCGTTPSVTWQQGQFWIAFAQKDHVYVTSTTNGEQFSKPVVVNSHPENIDSNGENRPKIAFSKETAVLSWTQKTSARYTGAVRYSHSTDGGKSFSAPRTINQNHAGQPFEPEQVSQRFDQLHVLPDGTVYLAWLGKVPVAATGQPPTSGEAAATISALYYATSDDQGKHFSPGYRVAESTCECCRLASATADTGVAFMWRHIFADNIRDHALAVVSGAGEVKHLGRATKDNWHIEACPHHGPDMAVAEQGFHLAWFTNGDSPGVHYGHYSPESGATRHRLIDDAASASHPQVQQHDTQLYIVWKRFDGERTSIQLKRSNDDGATWSESETVASTAGASDHPQLVTSNSGIHLAWHTQNDGLRLVALTGDSYE